MSPITFVELPKTRFWADISPPLSAAIHTQPPASSQRLDNHVDIEFREHSGDCGSREAEGLV